MVEPSEVGVRKCIKCEWLFVSRDIERIRRCADCKQDEAGYSCREIRTSSSHAPQTSQTPRDTS